MNREKLKEAIVSELDEIVNRLPMGKNGVVDVRVSLTTMGKNEEEIIYDVNAEFCDMVDETWKLEEISCRRR